MSDVLIPPQSQCRGHFPAHARGHVDASSRGRPGPGVRKWRHRPAPPGRARTRRTRERAGRAGITCLQAARRYLLERARAVLKATARRPCGQLHSTTVPPRARGGLERERSGVARRARGISTLEPDGMPEALRDGPCFVRACARRARTRARHWRHPPSPRAAGAPGSGSATRPPSVRVRGGGADSSVRDRDRAAPLPSAASAKRRLLPPVNLNVAMASGCTRGRPRAHMRRRTAGGGDGRILFTTGGRLLPLGLLVLLILIGRRARTHAAPSARHTRSTVDVSTQSEPPRLHALLLV